VSGWLGGDPDGMRGEANRLSGAADDLARVRASLFAAAEVSDVAAGAAAELADVEAWCETAAAKLAGAAAALEAVDATAIAALAGLSGAALHPGMPQVPSILPPDSLPSTVAAWWASLEPQARADLESVAGDRLAGLAGIPAPVRDRLNRAAIGVEAARVTAALSRADAALASAPADSVEAARLRLERDTLSARLTGSQALLAPGVTVLAFDPSGDGRYTAVVGDPTAAEHVAVLSPGVGTTLGSASLHLQEATDAVREAARRREQLATVAWLGYDAPEWRDVASFAAGRRAEAGAPALGTTVADLAALRDAEGAPPSHTTVVGHSYGAVVAGTAARDGHLGTVDELVLVGAAGSAVTHAADYPLADGARVWAATTDNDPIAGVYEVDTLAALVDRTPFFEVTPTGPAGEPHGADPSAPEFGAEPYDVSDISGHGSYLAGGSQAHRNLVRILTDREPGADR